MVARHSRRSILCGLLTATLVTLATASPATAAVPPGPALAWGANTSAELGDGTTTNRATPVPVCAVGATAPCAATLENASAIAMGDRHTLWLLADGTVAANGYNASGELGDGTTTNRTTPVRVCAVGATAPCAEVLSGVTAIAAGNRFSLALLADGSVVSWGENSGGYLGDGTTADRPVPGPVCATGTVAPCLTHLTGVAAIAAGTTHALALVDGEVRSWGSNYRGRLGDGTTTDRTVPVRVCAVGATAPCTSFLTGASAVDAGNHSLALVSGVPHGWGNNGVGELGDGTTTDRSTPVRTCAVGAGAPCGTVLSDVTTISAGDGGHSTALVGGVAHAWGSNFRGVLGDGTATNRNTPVRVCAPGATAPCGAYLSGVDAIDAGYTHTLAVVDGAAYAWGANNVRQLGDGTTTDRSTPVRVCAVGASAQCGSFLSDVTAVDAGVFDSAAIVSDPGADLAVALAATAPPLGSAIDYTITVTNAGPDAATSGTVTLTLPPATANASSATCAYAPTTGTVSCPVGTLPAGSSQTHVVRASFGPLSLGPLPASAARTASAPADPNPANDTDTATCTAVTSLVIAC